MKEMGVLGWIAYVLVVVGAINWGLMGIGEWNLVASIFGLVGTWLVSLVYILVGVSGLWLIYQLAVE